VQRAAGRPIPELAFCVGISRHRHLTAEMAEAARAAEEASVTMQPDPDEWRSAYPHRVLAIPG